jgi:hypothetical protein
MEGYYAHNIKYHNNLMERCLYLIKASSSWINYEWNIEKTFRNDKKRIRSFKKQFCNKLENVTSLLSNTHNLVIQLGMNDQLIFELELTICWRVSLGGGWFKCDVPSRKWT